MTDSIPYGAILIGTGSGLELIEAFIARNPGERVAVIDKDQPGGICLTRGCIPSKILLYSAELVRIIEGASKFGISPGSPAISFPAVMERMRSLIDPDIEAIDESLRKSEHIDYFHDTAEFVGPKILKVGSSVIRSDLIFLCTGSRPAVPPVSGLEEAGYLTSDTLLLLEDLPESIVVIGGGYIAAEYGHFLSAMGSTVTIIGRNPRFLPDEEPEVSAFARSRLGEHMRILTNHEVRGVRKAVTHEKVVTAVNRDDGTEIEIVSEEVLVAAGRSPNNDLLHPERGGIAVDDKGWIIVDKFRRTSQPGIWAFGDGTGLHQFKHMANQEARVVYRNVILGESVEMDDSFVPSAVFTDPEIASIGMREREAVNAHGEENILIGFALYEDTAKGIAMGADTCFAKVIADSSTGRILGAHIAGPSAAILIQEILTLMRVKKDTTVFDIGEAMHIHPALSEVIEHACLSLMPVSHYHHILQDHLGLEQGPGQMK